MTKKLLPLISILLIAVFLFTACTPAPTPTQAPAAPQQQAEPTKAQAPAGEKVKIAWWHISTKDPGLSDWKKMADDYMAAHPNVTIEITVLENEAFKTKLTTVMQSGEVPDIFQSWGGGTFNQQVEAGLLKDITAA